MEYKQVGEELPIEDDHGDRPEEDGEGSPRDVEIVPYEPLVGIEFQLKNFKVRDGRLIEQSMYKLRQRGQDPVNWAIQWEVSFQTLLNRFVRGIQCDGKEKHGEKAYLWLDDELMFDDQIALVGWLEREVKLTQAKKPDLKSRFD